MNTRTLLLVCVCLTYLSCENDPSGPGQIQVLHFDVNSSALYSWSIVEVDSVGDTTALATDTLKTRIASTDDVVGAYEGLIRMEAFSLPHYTATAQAWYSSSSDSLVEVAYSAAGATPIVLPKRGGMQALRAQSASYGTTNFRTPFLVRWAMKMKGIGDSVIERSNKRIVYRYPMVAGASWVSFTDPFVQTREVVGFEIVTAGNRSFMCAKIRTRLPQVDPELEWYDYVSLEGLVKRTLDINVVIVTVDDPDGMSGKEVHYSESLLLMD